MEKHILFFDIDGTIFYHKHFPFYLVKSIRKAQKAGHYVVLNTGRPKANLPNTVLKKVHWDGFVCGGAYAEFRSETVLNKRFKEEDFSALLDLIEEYKIPTIFDSTGKSRTVFLPYLNPVPSVQTIRDERWVERVFKFQMNTRLPQEVAEKIARYANVFNMGRYSDIFISGCTKATGMEAICKKTGIPVERTIAFGDNNNDLDMLRYAGKSVAMKRAPQAVIDVATYHAKRHKHGVQEGIKLFLFS